MTKDSKKVTKKKTTKKVKKDNYFKAVRKEMKMVKWPTVKEATKYTISTIVFVLIICGFFLLLGLIMSGILKGIA